jgi:hypothetical protein
LVRRYPETPNAVVVRNDIGIFSISAPAPTICCTDRTKLRVRFSVINLTNKDALYNFLSTFRGTHVVTPRAYQLQIGVAF